MRIEEKPVRQTVSLPPAVARRVKRLAKTQRSSASRVIVGLIESGLEAHDREREHFLQLADRLARAKDPSEVKSLKEDLARLTFGA